MARWFTAALALAAPFVAQAQQAQLQPPGTIGLPGGTGVFPATAESRTDAPGYTIYRPARTLAYRIPLVVWGNGACRDNGLSASHFLREVASHGFFVIANGSAREEAPVLDRLPTPNGPTPSDGPPPDRKADETTVAQMLGAIDWAARADRQPGGQFKGRIDATRVAVMGHSCGGLQALAAGADPRVKTVVAFGSGIYDRGQDSSTGGVQITKADLAKLHTPILYVNGGSTDVAAPNAADDVTRINDQPVFSGNLEVGHNGTFALADGGEWGQVAVAWLNWRLNGDMNSGRWFVGYDCRLCRDPRWRVVRKMFPETP